MNSGRLRIFKLSRSIACLSPMSYTLLGAAACLTTIVVALGIANSEHVDWRFESLRLDSANWHFDDISEVTWLERSNWSRRMLLMMNGNGIVRNGFESEFVSRADSTKRLPAWAFNARFQQDQNKWTFFGEMHVGWPMTCASFIWQEHNGICVTKHLWTLGVNKRWLVPTSISLVNGLANTAFFFGVYLMCFLAYFTIIRRTRRRRGLCTECKYIMSQGIVRCPECGMEG